MSNQSQLSGRDSQKNPTMAERQPFKAVLEHDYNTLFGLGLQALYELRSRPTRGSPMRSSRRLRADGSRRRNIPRLANEAVSIVCVYPSRVSSSSPASSHARTASRPTSCRRGADPLIARLVEDAYGRPEGARASASSVTTLRFDAGGDRASGLESSQLDR